MNALRGPKRKRAKASPILIALLLCAFNVFSFVMLRGAAYRSESALLKASSERIARQVAAQLQSMLALGRQLQTVLLSDEGKDYARIRATAEESIAANPFIDSITIAPGAIVRYAFPEEKNSSSIGHDLLNNPERMQALVEAVRTKQAVLQGPSVTAEGKNLAFLRIPVLDKTDLWGFVSIGFDTDRLLSAFEFSSAFPGLSIALVYSSPTMGAHGFLGRPACPSGIRSRGDGRKGWGGGLSMDCLYCIGVSGSADCVVGSGDAGAKHGGPWAFCAGHGAAAEHGAASKHIATAQAVRAESAGEQGCR